ncbi:MAG: hypothetical protein M9962_03270 [Oligoflexia bacterium]|nr:hypothetical protein [Oligoflexia bacterium]
MIKQSVLLGVCFLLPLTLLAEEASKVEKPVFTCDFSKFKNWKEFLEFEKEPILVASFKKEDGGEDYPDAASVYRVGKVTQGNCKGSIIYLGNVLDPDCPNKPSLVEDISILATEFSEYQEKPDLIYSAAVQNSDSCNWNFRLIEQGDKLFSANSSSRSISNLLAEKLKKKWAYDPNADYDKYAFGEQATLVNEKKEKITFSKKKTDYLEIAKNVSINDYSKFAEDPIAGTFYIRDRKAAVVLPDHTLVSVEPDLSFKKPGYFFIGYLDVLGKKLGVEEKNLSLLSGDSTWLEIKSANKDAFKKMYDGYLERIEEALNKTYSKSLYMDVPEIEKLTFEDYQKLNPLLFAKDALSRVQVYAKRLYHIPAMAEPLIYIYSDKKTQMNIKLCSHLKLTASYPKYNNSWDILVEPNKKLKNLDNNRYYNTLFWEGFAGHIPPYDQGWVVRSNEVEGLLQKILPEYGLNETETKEFMKYWVPKLSTAPFYQIEILPQTWVDDICPLEITPKPKSYLRVHMRAYALSEYKIIPEPPKPTKFKRDGLTVVEWSGIYN